MEVNYQRPTNIKTHPKREISLRVLLNIIGLVIFLGYSFMIITVPYGFTPDFQFQQLEETKLTYKKIKECLSFIFAAAIIYFFLVNIYFMGERGKQVVLISLSIILLFSISMVFVLI